MQSALVVGHLDLPILRQFGLVDAIVSPEDFKESFTVIKLVDHELSSNHVQHTEVRGISSAFVRWFLVRAVNRSKQTLH